MGSLETGPSANTRNIGLRRAAVKTFLPKYTDFIYFGNITDPVERLDPVAYIAFLNAHPNARWYTWSSRV